MAQNHPRPTSMRCPSAEAEHSREPPAQLQAPTHTGGLLEPCSDRHCPATASAKHGPADQPEQLEGLDFEGSQLLLDLLQLLQRRPESSTAMLLGHWYGTPEGNLLNRLAGQERLIPATGIEQEFTDTLLALTHLPRTKQIGRSGRQTESHQLR